jgi:hypothetical protein
MMKQNLAKSVAMSLLAPVIVGTVLGIYYALAVEQGGSKIFFSLLMSAIANGHIVGLSMAVLVVPGYMLMHKYNKVQYSGVLTLGMLGGALFSYLFAATAGMVFLVNTVMATIASGLFLYGLRRFN